MDFNTENALEDFRESQHDYFDDEGAAFRNVYLPSEAGRMLNLINLLEMELAKAEQKVEEYRNENLELLSELDTQH